MKERTYSFDMLKRGAITKAFIYYSEQGCTGGQIEDRSIKAINKFVELIEVGRMIATKGVEVRVIQGLIRDEDYIVYSFTPSAFNKLFKQFDEILSRVK